MNSFKAKLIYSLLGYGLIGGAVICAIFYYLFPAFYSNYSIWILVFFLMVESLALLFIEHSSKTVTAKQLVNSYLMTKVIKIIILLFSIVIYALVVKDNVKAFVLNFITLYLLFLGIETFLFTRIERRLKEKEQ